jgi:16S rRNA (guanine527-N7)-methyltransferase
MSVPPQAAALFGDRLPEAERYAALLADTGVERGLIGPAEAGRIWDRHIMNCAAVAELIPRQCTLADLGSGAGLPGIVLALLRPEAEVTLVESMARRVTFLTECVAELGLEDSVRVIRGRAEDLTGELAADIVTARAVAPLSKLAGWSLGICRPGGTVLAIKGASAAAEVAESRAELRQLGVTRLEVLEVGGASTGQAATVVRFTAPSRSAARVRQNRKPGGPGANPVAFRRKRRG